MKAKQLENCIFQIPKIVYSKLSTFFIHKTSKVKQWSYFMKKWQIKENSSNLEIYHSNRYHNYSQYWKKFLTLRKKMDWHKNQEYSSWKITNFNWEQEMTTMPKDVYIYFQLEGINFTQLDNWTRKILKS